MSMTEDKRAELMVDAWKTTVDTQRHFNDVAMKIRHFGFVILAAVIGAAGLSLRSGISLPVNGYNVPVGAFIMLFGAVVWLGIYFLDAKWYSPFLLGSVDTGINLEKKLNAIFDGCFTHSSDIKKRSNEVKLFGFHVDSRLRTMIFHFSMIISLILLTVLIVSMSTPIPQQPVTC
ncbi:hypothetical protein [Salinimonas iocasae]|uniref:Uncharacterized protein n=1 Tax=Salinimonas iocasae TaxID=2572577 RepID=A0A5B7YCM2_9ALTE|nr:hypothetical protein [Salinimonas iocasae]QCZ93301.1 hypothetical protein FBQ74_07290 [Salinimonas iocasae]